MIELLWPDGSVTTGANWREVEDAIRASQPEPFKTRRQFRREMRRRAVMWSGVKLGPGAPWTPKAFILQLADAEMFILTGAPEPPVQNPP